MKVQSVHVLQEKFDVQAAFYKLKVTGRLHTCRSVAEIRRKGSRETKQDALIVLSYPGNYAPSDKQALYRINPSNFQDIHVQKAQAQQVCFQLMRLLDRMDWNHVNVISLTDICSLNTINLGHDLYFMKKNRIENHSLFIPNRLKEIDGYLDSETKIIIGWGTHQKIKNMAQKALDILSLKGSIFGVKHKVAPYYYHPFSFRNEDNVKWLDQMESQLRANLNLVK